MTQTYDTLQEAEDAFYDALEEGDLSQLLAVWAESNDSCCLLPMYPMICPAVLRGSRRGTGHRTSRLDTNG